MPVVHVDTRQFSGVDPGLEPDEGSVWFWPYRPYVEDSALVSKQIVKVKTVDGLADPFLPETPIGQGVWVQLRAIKGAGEPWIVIIPSGDVNLFDLPHIDPDTLDPEAPLDPAWVAAAAALAADIETAQSDADAAQATADTALTSAGAASAAATAAQADATSALSGLASKVNTSTYTAGLATKADDAATTAALATKVNSSTYTAGLALKADQTALTAEANTRATDDGTIAQALSDYSTAANAAIALKVTAPTSPADGQLIAWSTSLNTWVKVNPTGAGRIASNINIANSPTGLTAAVGVGGGVGTQVVIPSTSISVTNSGGRPVVIHFGATFLQNVAGVGSVYLALTETTSGNVDKVSHITPLTNSVSPVIASQTLGAYEFDIGVVTTTRTFTLRGLLYTSSAACGGNILNSPTNPSWIRAVAE